MDFREDILGQFYILGFEGLSWPGVISFKDKASLRLLVVSTSQNIENTHPLASSLNGGKVDIIGESKELGSITLLNCRNTDHSVSHRYHDGISTHEIAFLPTEIWSGSKPFSKEDNFTNIIMEFSGIHSIIGTKCLGHKFIKNEEELAIKPLIANFREIFFNDETVKDHTVTITNPHALISFGSNVSWSFSHNTGRKVSTSDHCTLTCAKEISSKNLISYGIEIERFLSFICLKTIKSKTLKIETRTASYNRIWYLGKKENNNEAMYNEVLETFEHDKIAMTRALQRWFAPTKEEQLARWLFLDNFNVDTLSSSRLIAVLQATEILGRQAQSSAPYDKNKFKIAATKAADIIIEELGEHFNTDKYKQRFRNMITSNNRPSFRDHILAFLAGIPEGLRKHFLPDEEIFIKKLVGMRNLFVHMDEQKNMNFDSGKKYIGEMTSRLLALFVLHQSIALGLNPQSIINGLSNSGIGRAANHFLKQVKV